MKIALGVDHAAFGYKEAIRAELERLGHAVLDCGTDGPASVDYPAIALAVARAVRGGEAEFGVFLCGTGIGGSIAANKVRGVRAALCHEAFTARMARLHNNANVLCIGARVVGLDLALEIVRVFLATAWPNEARHARRLALIADAEAETVTSS
ncbi:MAG: putative sugar phosphate isomerase YwlF [bacterium ADurb.Bin429]|nr:MAG: putative sugar phosphate isomerase YwlF [bacterium ADurb.Bin429]